MIFLNISSLLFAPIAAATSTAGNVRGVWLVVAGSCFLGIKVLPFVIVLNRLQELRFFSTGAAFNRCHSWFIPR